ncbi:Phytocyanin domain-containing protein [Citrus sinensis]|uniref:Phytocyanin domain-containing protein n=1 Tax=Citrus sinensis TaxID=2711 RepID=A0ACB8MXF8_CITSI|nr:Phytocyanin domain-containing protein [Citrus sinensis]
MEQGRKRVSPVSVFFAFFCFLLLRLLCFSGSAEAYKNYTVGDSLGWYDSQEKPAVDYQQWADAKNFSLGDFLIFNTDTNHSVVQTYNFTTYKECDYDDALDSDTKLWSAADPSNTATSGVTVPVPLLKEGTTYFFSSDYDGDQCRNGQHFKINVSHGKGLPESLKSPSEQSPAPNSADYNNDESAPDLVVPSTFNKPRGNQNSNDDDDGDNVKKQSGAVSLLAKYLDWKFNGILFLLGIISIF